MSGEFITWATLLAAIMALVAVGKMFADAGVTKQKAAAAERSAHEAHQRIDRLTETSATTADVAAAETRFADAVTGLRSDFQHMAGRLDGLLSAVLQKGTH